MSQSVKAMKTTYLCLSGRDSQLLDELELEAVMAESALSVVLAHIRALFELRAPLFETVKLSAQTACVQEDLQPSTLRKPAASGIWL